MAEEPRFEITITWPARPDQKLPPEPGFSRDSRMSAQGHPEVPGAQPPVFGGNANGYNPEELMLLSLSQCHMLTYLALVEKAKLVVRRYEDRATGSLGKGASGKTQMVEATLRPRVTLARGSDVAAARALHERAHAHCFMGNSVNFPVRNEPEMLEE
ncbi:MAG: OsmC family protein [Usitatibacter sp.]